MRTPVTAAEPAGEHPSWCQRQHVEGWPIHDADLGAIEISGEGLVLGVRLMDYGDGRGPVIALDEHHGTHTEVIDLPAGDAGALSVLLQRAYYLLMDDWRARTS